MRHFIPFSIIALLALSSVTILSALAQSDDVTWAQPVNLSQSGAASQPMTAVAPDGTLHVVWWDSLLGAQYARATVGFTQTVWTKAVTIPSLWGDRRVVTNTQTGKVTVSLSAPRDSRLIVDGRGNTYTFWLDAYDQLQSMQNRGTGWSGNVTQLSDSAVVFDVTTDLSGTLHLAYVRATDSQSAPAGIYYRSTSSGEWSAATLVYASPYFRVSRFENSHISVAGDGSGRRAIGWDDARQGQSFYAYSANNGQTWSNPQSVTGNNTEPATQAYVTVSPNGEFLLFWQDPSHASCTLSQRRSADGGQNWRAPERMMANIGRCPERWQFSVGSDQRLWSMGTSRPNSPSKTGTSLLATWDGQVWSDPIEINVRFREPSTSKSISLSYVEMALAGQSLSVVGGDGNGDVWATYNNIGLNGLLPALRPVWGLPRVLSEKTPQASVQSLPAMVAIGQGKFLALWSQSFSESERGTALYASSGDNSAWSRAVQVLKSPTDLVEASSNVQPVPKAEQPALAADDQSRVHAVWSGGTSGEVLYSWTHVRDTTSATGWSEPVALPTISRLGSWPDIVADPRGETLHVVYAVPFNEGRGIYYVRSNDGGNTWSKPTVVVDATVAKWTSVDKPRLALDPRANVLHVVWLRADVPDGTEPQAIYYSRSTDEGQTWSAPLRVAEGRVDWPRVAVMGTRQALLVWNQARSRNPSAPNIEVWSQFSSTGGDRWSAATRVSGIGEVSGPVGLASDDTQAFLASMGQGAGGENALVYARWNGQSWEAQEKLELNQDYALGNAVAAAIAPGTSQLGVVLRIWVKQSDGSSQFEVWTTQRDVIALPSSDVPIPTFTPLPTSTAMPTATPRPTATPKPQLPVQPATQASKSTSLLSQAPLVLSGVLATVIVIAALAIRAAIIMRRR